MSARWSIGWWHLFSALAIVFSLATYVRTFANERRQIVVTTTADELNVDGDCSLREAIRAANFDAPIDMCVTGAGADTIRLSDGVYILGLLGRNENAAATGDLDIIDDLAIIGSTLEVSIVDGGGIDRVFEVQGEAQVQFNHVIIQNGQAGDSPGGAIAQVDGVLMVTDSIVRNSTARLGGGISAGGTLIIEGSTISGNTAFDRGGGIAATNVLTITNSTVNMNASRFGGGIANLGLLSVINSTISTNTAEKGGGIASTGTLTLTSSTISQNTAALGSGIQNDGGTAIIANTLLATNIAPSGEVVDCSGILTSRGYNLIQHPGTCLITGDLTGNLVGADPRLGRLQHNGGRTPTHALQTESPALDAAHPGGLTSPTISCPPIDQRGVTRPQDGDDDGFARCDIGAYELEAPIVPSCPTAYPPPEN